MSCSRRQFVQSSAAAIALSAGTTGPSLFAAEEKPAGGDDLPIVDCHQHLWDLTKFKLPWVMPGSLMAKNYGMEEYQKAAEGLHIAQAVYMEVDVAADEKTKEAQHLIEICKSGKFPTRSAVIGGEPGNAGFAKYANQFKGSPYIKGVRQVLHSESAAKGMCLEKQFVKSVQLLGELGMSFDLCMRPTELLDGGKLCDLCPDTRFILDHCGNADVTAFHVTKRPPKAEPEHEVEQWKKDIAAVATRKNVICKISGVIARMPTDWPTETLAPIVNHCLDSFGPERVIFGSDWPVCLLGGSYKAWVHGLLAIIAERPLGERKKLLHDNAVAFYGLKV